MDTSELLLDGFDRVGHAVAAVLDGASSDVLSFRPDPDANSIAWLLWHLTRVQDDHLAEAFGHEQEWRAGGWAERFALPFAPDATGYGQSSSDVAAVPGDAELLLGYHRAVHAATRRDLAGAEPADLDRVVDTNWDPPVTLGVRLVSVIADDLQHAGQAAYVRGLAERTR